VLFVATLLDTLGNVSVPPGLPPIYPTFLVPEQFVHSTVFAPFEIVLGRLRLRRSFRLVGPAFQAPPAMLRIQFTSLCKVAVVPEMVRGSQMQVAVIMLSECHLSPMYLGTAFSPLPPLSPQNGTKKKKST
jgi:hypothetical protein